MSHKARRAPPIECPLASLGHTTSVELHHPTYHHHPLSSSPLDLDPIPRTSSALSGNANGSVYSNIECDENDSKTINDSQAAMCNNYENQMFSRNNLKKVKQNITYRSMPYEYNGESSDNVSYRQDGNSSDSSRNLRYENRRLATEILGSDRKSSSNSNRNKQITPNAFNLDSNICYHQPLNKEQINHGDQYYLENKMRTLLLQENTNDFQNFPYERHFLVSSNGTGNNSPNYMRRPSSPSETSESDRFERTTRESPASSINRSRKSYNYLTNRQVTTPNKTTLMDGLASRIGRMSPSYDQGYHTLLSPSPSGSGTQQQQQASSSSNFRSRSKTENVFDKLPDELCVKLFSWIDSRDLSNISKVCKRFDSLVWQPILWRTITLKGFCPSSFVF